MVKRCLRSCDGGPEGPWKDRSGVRRITGELGSSENGRFTLWSRSKVHYFTCDIDLIVRSQHLQVDYVRRVVIDRVNNRPYLCNRAITIKTIDPYEHREDASDQ